MRQNKFRFYIYLFVDRPTKLPFSMRIQIRVRGTKRAPRYHHSFPIKPESRRAFSTGRWKLPRKLYSMRHLSAPRSFRHPLCRTRALCVGLTPACYQYLLLTFPLVPTQPHSPAISLSLDRTRNNHDGLRLSTTVTPASPPTWSTRMEIDRKRT